MAEAKAETLALVQTLLEALPEEGLYITLVQLLPTLLFAFTRPGDPAVSTAAGALLLDGLFKSQTLQEAFTEAELHDTILSAFPPGKDRNGALLKLLDLTLRALSQADRPAYHRIIASYFPPKDGLEEDVLFAVGLIQWISQLTQLELAGCCGLKTVQKMTSNNYDATLDWLLRQLEGKGIYAHDSLEDELVCIEILRLVSRLPQADCFLLADQHNLLDLLKARLHSTREAIQDAALQTLAALFVSMPDRVWAVLPSKIGCRHLASLGLLLERSPTDSWKTRVLEEKCSGDYMLQLFEGLSSTFEGPRKVSYYHFHQLATWQHGVALTCGSQGVLALLMSGKGEYADIATKFEIMRKVLETLQADDAVGGRDLACGHRRAIEAFVKAGAFGKVDDGEMRVAAQAS